MGHEYIKESDTFSTSRNGTVPKPTQQDVTNNKVLRADGSWVAQSGGGGGSSHTYSTTEQLIGTWIDGKDAYEITINLGSMTKNTNNTVSVPMLANVSEVISIMCVAYSAYFDQWYHIPNVHSNFSTYGVGIILLMSTSEVRVWCGSNVDLDKCYLILEYTKITT